MKSITYIILTILGVFAIASCEKKDYPRGVSELEHHYYAIFVPNNNTGVSVFRNQTALLKFPVQFYSTYVRDYDAIAKYAIVTTGIPAPAIAGQDFNIVDKNGNVIPSPDGTYSIVFPKAIQAMDTIYVKLLNNPTPGIRKMEIQIQDNITPQFDVDIFSTAFRRPVEIK
ncbi:MAG: hypothetical protein H7Y42_15635 [Chitinophagaceae bacterium]|nr:hypothetical protein [Chitinophagaceae bacterium]